MPAATAVRGSTACAIPFAVATLSDWLSRRPRRSRADAAALQLPRACRPRLVVLVSAGDAGAAAVGGRTARARGEPAMTLLAPTLEAFFTERLIGQRRASPHTIASYRDTFGLLLAFAARADRQAAIAAAARGSRRAADQRVPRAPRTAAAQQRAHPQHPARRDPLDVPLRRAEAPRTRRADRPRARDPAQTRRPAAGDVPDRPRGRRAARRPGPHHAGSAGATTRCCCSTIQTGLRVSELIGLRSSRRLARPRPAPAMRRQRSQDTRHPAHPPDRRRATRMAGRAARRS